MPERTSAKSRFSPGFIGSLAGATILGLLASVGVGRALEHLLLLTAGTQASVSDHGAPSRPESRKAAENRYSVPSKRSYLDPILSRNIFDSSAVGATSSEEVKPGEEGRRTDLKATLLATVSAIPEESSSALIATGEKSETRILGYGINDDLLGEATIVRILPKKVILKRNDGTIEYLDMGETGLDSKSKSRLSGSEEKAVDGITKLGEDSYAVDASVLDDALSNFDTLASQVRAIPHRGPDGEIDGYRLSSVRRNSLLYKLGIKNGDIIHTVNGQALTSASGALGAYQNLQNERSFSFEITRRNQKKTLEYEVR